MDNTSNTSLLFAFASLSNHVEQVAAFFSLNVHSPDFHVLNSDEESLKIEDVRQLAQDILLKPYQDKVSVFVVLHIDKASLAAQNALLKLLEEPPASAQVILTTAHLSSVLPTIQSRCLIRTIEEKILAESHTSLDEFLSVKTPAQTISLSEKYKEREAALQFLEHVVHELHLKNQKTPTFSQTLLLQRVITAREYIAKNVNVRLVLEDLLFRLEK